MVGLGWEGANLGRQDMQTLGGGEGSPTAKVEGIAGVTPAA